jgi:mannan endo-1,4-beta-mannosidase
MIKSLLLASLLTLLEGYEAQAQGPAADAGPSDKDATKETVNLYRNLKRSSAKGFLFGHQDDLAYGVGWKYQAGRSDVKDVCGDYPALYGWDCSGLESGSDKDIDGVPFKNIRQYVQEAYARGGVATFSWHCPSPLGEGKNAWDTTHGTVSSILPGAVNNDLYKEWLDKVAKFLGSLKGAKGEAIPVLFRPFHEHSGSWFWWGRKECTPMEYKTLWRFTKYYLNTVKNLHNILWVFNSSGDFKTQGAFLERYPGDDAVDVVSFDTYQYTDPAKDDVFQQNVGAALSVLDSVASQTGKIEALAETGYEQIPFATWWTGVLEKAIGNHPIAYVLVWRNLGWNEYLKPPHMHYYAPYKGQISASDFVTFYSMDNTLFEKDAAKLKLYE